MSKYKIMAVAVAAALAAPAAFATSVHVGPANDRGPAVLAKNDFINASSVASAVQPLDIVANATTVYLGRNTGYNIRVTLSQGVFNGDPTPTPLDNISAATVAGGGNDQSTVTFSVTPAAGGVIEGSGIRLSDIAIDGVAALGEGGTINVTVEVFDPVGGNRLGDSITTALIRTVEGWAVDFKPVNADQRIDVGAASSKRWFGDRWVGSGNPARIFNAGQIEIDYHEDLDDSGLNLGQATAAVSVSGTNFAAFRNANAQNPGRVFLSNASDCSSADLAGAVSADGTSVSFEGTNSAAAVNGTFLCFDANTQTEIAAQSLTASVTVRQPNKLASPAFGSENKLTAMRYNGSVVYVDHFNPARNADQQSYLRIINPSNIDGLVTITAVCENGAAASGAATFTLGAGESRQVNSTHVEQGGNGVAGGVGACASGKSRLTVTGEFADMGVQNFLRNNTSAGVVNTHISNVTEWESISN